MNKLLHVLVYVFLALAAAALYFELDLNRKRTELTDRNRMQENYFVQIAKTIERAAPAKDAAFEVKVDTDAVENKVIDSPATENLLDDYPAELEQANLETFNWDNQRAGLRNVYVLDAEGKPVMDGNQPQTRDSDEEKMLRQLFDAAKEQQSRLNATRAALTDLRGKLEKVVGDLNKLKPEARQDKVTIDEKSEKITKLEGEKTELEGTITTQKSQIGELNTEITSLKDEVSAAKDETEVQKEEVEKQKKLVKDLSERVRYLTEQLGRQVLGSVAMTSLPAGDKGKIVEVDNTNMFAIVEFSAEAMKELKGEDGKSPLQNFDLGVKRPGFQGPAGEFVGRIRLRQEVKGKPYVICDILSAWEQDKLHANDIIFAD